MPDQNGQAGVEVTPEMITAGVNRLGELQGEVGSAYLVEQVYRAMVVAAAPIFSQQVGQGASCTRHFPTPRIRCG